jgi:hypothetical protein
MQSRESPRLEASVLRALRRLVRPKLRPKSVPLLIPVVVFDRDAERRVLLPHGVHGELQAVAVQIEFEKANV